jgi:hypothetical protein
MSGSSSPDYKELFLKAERKGSGQRHARGRQRKGRSRQRSRGGWQRNAKGRQRNGSGKRGSATDRRLFQSSSDIVTISFGGPYELKHRLAQRQAKSLLPPENTALYDCFRGANAKRDNGKFTNLFAATFNRQKRMHDIYSRRLSRWKTMADDSRVDRLAANRI